MRIFIKYLSTSKAMQQSQEVNRQGGREKISEKYRGIISLLRFFRRTGQLYMLDRFANALDASMALGMLREMMSIVDRLKPKVVRVGDKELKVCYDEVISNEEAEWYRHLGARVEEVGDRKLHVLVECPARPSEDELENLRKDIESMNIKPSELVALAYARGKARR